MKLKLKPCPCCGHYATMRDWYYVKCANSACGASGGIGTTKQEAADKWNKRHNEPPMIDEVPNLDSQKRESIVEVFAELRQKFGHHFDHINDPDDLLG